MADPVTKKVSDLEKELTEKAAAGDTNVGLIRQLLEQMNLKKEQTVIYTSYPTNNSGA
jgi:hypothetical protein|tara:strand:- start:43 stop:216 length:174 start_codon:yes stop_codon:yes gene_type:complete